MFGIVELTRAVFMIVKKDLIVAKEIKQTPFEVHGYIRVVIIDGLIDDTLVRYISQDVIDSGELEALRLEAKRYAENYDGVWSKKL